MTKKISYSLFLLGLCNYSYGQDYNDFLNGMQYNFITSSAYTESANMDAMGNLLLKNSLANINNQKAETLRLNNDMLRTSNYFEKRQMNLYHTSLYKIQKREINKRLRDNTLTKADLDMLFDDKVKFKNEFVGIDGE
jgi:hypothetical protein